jgi:teichuronic acid biosynthesis glycosyltransferase TuaC
VRVAILTTSYPRTPGDPAGHFIETEALRLAGAGSHVHVIAPGRGNLRVESRGRGSVTLWGAGGGSLFGSPGAVCRARQQPLRLLELVRFLPNVRRLLGALGPFDRTVAHFLVPSGYPLALFATGEIEVVLHGSDVRFVAGLPLALRSHVVRRLLDRGARFRFVSNELRLKLAVALDERDRERLWGASRVELPPIDVPCQRRADVAHGPGTVAGSHPRSGRPRWVVCGRLIASKGVDRAIREAARRNVDLTVIGDGPMRAELEALAASFEPRATFVGHLPRTDALALIAGSERLLHLSEAEGAPTVIREARALGVPVLATPVGDVPGWALEDPGIEIFRPA